jgi:phospholipase/lecithinase/hemolysin
MGKDLVKNRKEKGMGRIRLLVQLAVIFCLGAIAAQAAKPHHDSLYVFGDSYCDVGNLYTADGGVFPAAPYYNGRFSNGPIWLDHVAGFLGLKLTWIGPRRAFRGR